MNRRIGLLGGTFDPIHRGHIDLAVVAQATLGLDRVLVIPTNFSPHRQAAQASIFHRFAMVALTVAGRPGWRASDLELRHPSMSYTVATLERFHERGYQPDELYFLIGADAFADIRSWKGFPQVLDGAHFAVVSRPGHPASSLAERLPELRSRMVQPPVGSAVGGTRIFLIDADTSPVSSTAIRQLRAEGRSISRLVDGGVEQHIEQHGLYSSPVPDRRRGRHQESSSAGRLHGQS